MYIFNFSSEKNKALKSERGKGFEDAIGAIKDRRIIDIIKHPNQEKYKGQNMYILEIDNYAYVVPYIKDDDKKEIFLKTMFASRKMTAKYLR